MFMKNIGKILFLASLTAASLAVSGCDFFRELVGRPTSEWIAEKEARIKADKELRSAIEDVISEEESETDSVDGNGMELPFKYYIVVGVFASRSNAQALAAKASAKGYECVLVDWNNGMTAVTLNPTDSLEEVRSSLNLVSKESFCPKDAWIMDGNRQKI